MPSLNTRRSPFTALSSPVSLYSPIYPSGTRNVTSPLVGDLKGWISNIFNWKGLSPSVGVLYSPKNVQTTRANVTRILDSLGVLVTIVQVPPAYQTSLDQPCSFHCRIDQPTVDPSSGIQLKSVRFKLEIYPAGCPAMSPTDEDHPHILATPYPASGVHSGSCPTSPNFANGHAFIGISSVVSGSRPKSSIFFGGRSSSHGTPLPSPALPGSARPDSPLPPGCLCAIALVYEKGSSSSYRLVWQKLIEEFGDSGRSYPCLTPVVPNSPQDHQRLVG